MATTMFGLPTFSDHSEVLSADFNQIPWAVDRLGRAVDAARNQGVIAGWQAASGVSTITSGQGVIGGCYCVTTGSQAISGLQASSTNYLFARLNSGSPTSGTVDFVARLTSSPLTNPDGATYAVRLGYVTMSGNTISGVYGSGTSTFPRDKLVRLADNTANLMVVDGPFGLATSTVYSGSYTAGDKPVILADASGGEVRVNLPAADSVKWRCYHVKKIAGSAASQVVLSAASGETIDGQDTQVITAQYNSLQVVCDGSDWYII